MGESEAARDKMLYELEQECLEVYRRRVDVANRSRALLRQAIADSEAEFAVICSAMGELPVHIRQVWVGQIDFMTLTGLSHLLLLMIEWDAKFKTSEMWYNQSDISFQHDMHATLASYCC